MHHRHNIAIASAKQVPRRKALFKERGRCGPDDDGAENGQYSKILCVEHAEGDTE